MRKIDDQIIYALNSIIPTESFKAQVDAKKTCKELHQQIVNIHEKREKSIKNCRDSTRNTLEQLKEEKKNTPDDPKLMNNLRNVQNTLRRLESELDVETIVKNRTNKIYNEKCRGYYKPGDKLSWNLIKQLLLFVLLLVNL